ncbi:MAG: 3'(2'),5'-bisphosphate nucleotidase CysQ [Spirochaetia bacterium]|nr:3'(2'),5'-bisphosphate nucleotidase CysQ [Spirochaetia bacterium]
MITSTEEESLLQGLTAAVHEAALAVLSVFNSKDFKVSSKGEAGPLTTADLLANSILETKLSQLLPDAGWLSEESVDDARRLSRRFLWVVDPIDGTREFVEGLTQFSVSAGLCDNGLPLMGAVAMPAENLIVYGSKNLGVKKAPLNALTRIEDCSLSGRKELEGCVMLVSQTEDKRGTFDSLKQDFDIRPMGSIARKLALLASGEGDLVVSLFPKNDWDICGGVAMILSHPDSNVIDLRTQAQRLYNQADPKSFGICGGNSGLVEAFRRYFLDKNLTLREKY